MSNATAPAPAGIYENLTHLGFYVVPAKSKTALPAGWPGLATNDPAKAAALFAKYPGYPYASIYTGAFGAGEALLVVDIDPWTIVAPEGMSKADPDQIVAAIGDRLRTTYGLPATAGKKELARAIAANETRRMFKEFNLPRTRAHGTPSGGVHLIFRVPHALTQGSAIKSLGGKGFDTRSDGGQIHFGKGYTHFPDSPEMPAPAPDALIRACGARAPAAAGGPSRRRDPNAGPVVPLDKAAVTARAIEHLKSLPVAQEGERNQCLYRTAAKLRGIGVEHQECRALCREHFRCAPPMDETELDRTIRSVYEGARTEQIGGETPQAQFSPVTGYFDDAGKWTAQRIREEIESGSFAEHARIEPDRAAEAVDMWDLLDLAPEAIEAARGALARATTEGSTEHPFVRLNLDHAFVMIKGGHAILHETTDARGNPAIDLLKESSFHKKHAAWMMQTGKTTRPVTQLWMEHPSRRSYAGLCFMPGKEAAPHYYNLFRGFTVEPASVGTPRALSALDAWKEHLFENVARGNEDHAHWITGWLAHLIQRPHEKPLVALALYGGKGVGKNCLIERVCDLLGAHAMITADSRYVVGNFNSHLEHCLLLGMDETFWAGDRHMEGKLKALVTGKEHIIERKGFEPYPAENLTRVVILGNNEHLVPASHDERRYAVFHVGDGRKQDRAFFQEMKAGMEAGGSGLLLHYLLTFDLSTVDVNQAPSTEALTENKLASLPSAARWLAESLIEGAWLGTDFGDGDWPETTNKAGLYAAYRRWSKDRNEYRAEDIRTWARTLRTVLGDCVRDYRPNGQERQWTFNSLEVCRDRLRVYLGGAWEAKT